MQLSRLMFGIFNPAFFLCVDVIDIQLVLLKFIESLLAEQYW